MTRATFGRSSTTWVSRSTREATTSSWYGSRPTSAARSDSPLASILSLYIATIDCSRPAAVVSGSRSYVSGKRKPSSRPFAYAGRPSALVFFAAACSSLSGRSVLSAISLSVPATVSPSGIVTRANTLASGSSISASAATPLISLRSLYVPGWMDTERGSSLAALRNASSLFTTPLATRGTTSRRRRRRRRSDSYRRRSERLGREYCSGGKNPRSCGAWVTRRSCVGGVARGSWWMRTASRRRSGKAVRSLRPPGAVQPSLKYEDGGRTVNDRSPLTSPGARLGEPSGGGYRRQSLIGQPDRNRVDTLRECGGVVAGGAGPGPRLAGQGRPQADDHPDGRAVDHQRGQPGQVGTATRVTGQGGQRGGEHAAGVAGRDADPHRAHVHPDPHTVHPLRRSPHGRSDEPTPAR